MVVYEGIAVSQKEKRFSYTREAVIRELAVKLAGSSAQELVSQNFSHDAGKSNDIESATGLAQYAILKFGLSEIWGSNEAVPQDMSIKEYVAGFSDAKKAKYEMAKDALLSEAKLMADSVMLTNRDALINLGTALAGKGEMGAEDIENFYKTHGQKLNTTEFASLMKNKELFASERAKWNDPQAQDSRKIEAGLSSLIPRPQVVANIDRLVSAQKTSEVSQVALPENLPLTQFKVSVADVAKTTPSEVKKDLDTEPTLRFSFNGKSFETCRAVLMQIPRK
jgi:hypothetical protein